MRHTTRRTTTSRATLRRNARIAAFIGDGMALVAFIILIMALVALVPTVFGDGYDCTGLPTQAHVDRCVAYANGDMCAYGDYGLASCG